MINASKQAKNNAHLRALSTLPNLADSMVRIRQAILVCALCLVWNSPVQGVAQGQIGQPPNPQQSTWRLGEITDLQSWYWGEVPAVPKVSGGKVICAPITGGQRCVLVAQGEYRYLMADGVIVEDRRYKLRLLQVWR